MKRAQEEEEEEKTPTKRQRTTPKIAIDADEAHEIFDQFIAPQRATSFAEFEAYLFPDINEYRDKVLVTFTSNCYDGITLTKRELITTKEWNVIRHGDFESEEGCEGQGGGGFYHETNFDDYRWKTEHDPYKIRKLILVDDAVEDSCALSDYVATLDSAK
jgi:hypothetical protein